jgi:hypothetical protein
MTDFLEALSDVTIVIGAMVVMVVAVVIFVRSLREGLWTAIKRFTKFLFENWP